VRAAEALRLEDPPRSRARPGDLHRLVQRPPAAPLAQADPQRTHARTGAAAGARVLRQTNLSSLGSQLTEPTWNPAFQLSLSRRGPDACAPISVTREARVTTGKRKVSGASAVGQPEYEGEKANRPRGRGAKPQDSVKKSRLGCDEGAIIAVLEPGYLLHGRLLRPARVVVAR
jgi:hypothetical protein